MFTTEYGFSGLPSSEGAAYEGLYYIECRLFHASIRSFICHAYDFRLMASS